jgi:hypothetical protein
MLRSSIQKPQVLCSNDPILSYGFINLINVFEKLTVNLYDWVAAGGADSCLETPPASSIQSSLSKPVSVDGVLEIQQVDILITQQWLQAMMWKLSIGHATQADPRHSSVLPFHLPVLVGKSVMEVIGASSQGAVDAHGIGMVRLHLLHHPKPPTTPLTPPQEQKLFDLGTSVADVTRSLGPKSSHHLAESTVQPNELLWGILHTLDRIRGSQSYLFPTLLEQCKSVLGFDCTITMGNYLPPLSVPPDADDANNEPWLDAEHAWPQTHGLPDDIDAHAQASAASVPPLPPDLAYQDPMEAMA